MRLDITKQDIRKGRKTGCPVSAQISLASKSVLTDAVPGCSVESITFFACHISGVIDLISPCLYEETSFFAFSRPDAETKRVLTAHGQRSG
jgi:hypothetical protein